MVARAARSEQTRELAQPVGESPHTSNAQQAEDGEITNIVAPEAVERPYGPPMHGSEAITGPMRSDRTRPQPEPTGENPVSSASGASPQRQHGLLLLLPPKQVVQASGETFADAREFEGEHELQVRSPVPLQICSDTLSDQAAIQVQQGSTQVQAGNQVHLSTNRLLSLSSAGINFNLPRHEDSVSIRDKWLALYGPSNGLPPPADQLIAEENRLKAEVMLQKELLSQTRAGDTLAQQSGHQGLPDYPEYQDDYDVPLPTNTHAQLQAVKRQLQTPPTDQKKLIKNVKVRKLFLLMRKCLENLQVLREHPFVVIILLFGWNIQLEIQFFCHPH